MHLSTSSTRSTLVLAPTTLISRHQCRKLLPGSKEQASALIWATKLASLVQALMSLKRHLEKCLLSWWEEDLLLVVPWTVVLQVRVQVLELILPRNQCMILNTDTQSVTGLQTWPSWSNNLTAHPKSTPRTKIRFPDLDHTLLLLSLRIKNQARNSDLRNVSTLPCLSEAKTLAPMLITKMLKALYWDKVLVMVLEEWNRDLLRQKWRRKFLDLELTCPRAH